VEHVISAFITDVKAILAEDGTSEPGMSRLVDRMGALTRDRDVLATHEAFTGSVAAGDGYADTGRRSLILYNDDTGLTLVRSRFDPDEPTPIHSHSTWGVVGVYAGHDLHQAWRRLDGGTGASDAELEMIDEQVLGPGDVVTIPHPPQDIHRQQGANGEAAYEFVLFGANAMVIPRLIFDPEQRIAREVIPGKD